MTAECTISTCSASENKGRGIGAGFRGDANERISLSYSFTMPADSKDTTASALKTQVEQLRIEASMQRKKVSEAGKDLMDFCDKGKGTDPLIVGVTDGQNPFQEKRGCALL